MTKAELERDYITRNSASWDTYQQRLDRLAEFLYDLSSPHLVKSERDELQILCKDILQIDLPTENDRKRKKRARKAA